MKFLYLSGLLALCLLTACNNQSDYSDSLGHSGNFSDHHGQWLIINYWAVWCKPCIEEISELNQLARSQHGKVVLFGVDFDDSAGAALQTKISQLGIEFPVLNHDPSSILGYDRPVVLPTTVIFNPQGKLHRHLTGPQTQQTLLQALEAN
jgi:thiol-disulfide isomerase/thioredoxin